MLLSDLPPECLQRVFDAALPDDDSFVRQRTRFVSLMPVCRAFAHAARGLDLDLLAVPSIESFERLRRLLSMNARRFGLVTRLHVRVSFAAANGPYELFRALRKVTDLCALFLHTQEFVFTVNDGITQAQVDKTLVLLQLLGDLPFLRYLTRFGLFLPGQLSAWSPTELAHLLWKMPALEELHIEMLACGRVPHELRPGGDSQGVDPFTIAALHCSRPFNPVRLSLTLPSGIANDCLLAWLRLPHFGPNHRLRRLAHVHIWPSRLLCDTKGLVELCVGRLNLFKPDSGPVIDPSTIAYCTSLRTLIATKSTSITHARDAAAYLAPLVELRTLVLCSVYATTDTLRDDVTAGVRRRAMQADEPGDEEEVRERALRTRDEIIKLVPLLSYSIRHLSLAREDVWTPNVVVELESTCRERDIALTWTPALPRRQLRPEV